MELFLGIDDAGRGPVVGPLVLAGCLLNKDSEKKLKKLGVDDSKSLTHKRREFLENKIKELAETFEIVIIHPEEIDQSNGDGTKLNEIEAIAAAKIINKINKGYKKIKVILDCPSVNRTKWQNYLMARIEDLSNLELYCEHKADKNHVSVAAASILAKCTREKEMEKIKKTYGNAIGSGYCSDPLTSEFLKQHAKKFENDGIFRKTWVTWKMAYEKIVQRKLE